MQTAPNYLNPAIPSGLKRVRIPILEANEQSLSGYGYLVTDPHEIEIEIKIIESIVKLFEPNPSIDVKRVISNAGLAA